MCERSIFILSLRTGQVPSTVNGSATWWRTQCHRVTLSWTSCAASFRPMSSPVQSTMSFIHLLLGRPLERSPVRTPSLSLSLANYLSLSKCVCNVSTLSRQTWHWQQFGRITNSVQSQFVGPLLYHDAECSNVTSFQMTVFCSHSLSCMSSF